MKIIKRSGTEVIFDKEKILAAVCKANESVVDSERMTEAQKEALRRFQEAMGEVPAANSASSETTKPEHEKHEKHEKHERKGFFGGKKKK